MRTLVGQKLPVKVIEVDRTRRRLILSNRQARRERESIQRREVIASLQEGSVCHGKVTSLCPFGAFVDLGGLEGLVHVSEISWQRVQHPEEVLHVGQEVDVIVLSVDRELGRVALSLKRLAPDPWEAAAGKYFGGQLVEGVITNVLDFGAFVALEPGIEGLVHISEMGEDEQAEDGRATVKPGDHALFRVIQVDMPHHRIALSMRRVDREDTLTSDQGSA